jgi:hypothetical protein
MFDFTGLPLTPDQARAARNYCGMTQAQAATTSSLPAYKIKRFELGTTIPDTEFLAALRTFYEGKGYQFPDTEKPGAQAKAKGTVFPGGVVPPGDDGDDAPPRKVTRSTVQHIRIASSLSDEEIGSILEHIEGNEEQVEEMLQAKVDGGLLGGLSDRAEAHHAKAVRLLAENGTLWAKLVGRNLVNVPAPVKGAKVMISATPKFHSDLLANTQAHVHSAVAGDKAAAAAKRKAHKPANLFDAIFG